MIQWGTAGEWAAGINALILVGGRSGFGSKSETAAPKMPQTVAKKPFYEARMRDLDETRPLLLMLDTILRHDRYTEVAIDANLRATLANALSSHSKLMTTEQALDFVQRMKTAFIQGGTKTAIDEVEEQIRVIDNLIESEAAQSSSG